MIANLYRRHGAVLQQHGYVELDLPLPLVIKVNGEFWVREPGEVVSPYFAADGVDLDRATLKSASAAEHANSCGEARSAEERHSADAIRRMREEIKGLDRQANRG